MFARWGRFVYRTRWWMLGFSAVLLGLSIGGLITGGNLAGNGSFGADLPAGKASKLIQQEMRPNQATSTAPSSRPWLDPICDGARHHSNPSR